MSEIYIGSSYLLPVARGWVEDEIDRTINGLGEVSGGGQGVSGWNIDVEIYKKKDVINAARLIKPVLISNGAANDTTMSVYWKSSDQEGEEIDWMSL